MEPVWQLNEAQSRFDEIVDQAITHGPQVIAHGGSRAAVVLSYAVYRRLQPDKTPLGNFFSRSPLAGVEDLDLERDQSCPGPDIDL